MDAVDAADSLTRRTARAVQQACHVTLVIIEKVASRRLLNAQVDAMGVARRHLPDMARAGEVLLRLLIKINTATLVDAANDPVLQTRTPEIDDQDQWASVT